MEQANTAPVGLLAHQSHAPIPSAVAPPPPNERTAIILRGQQPGATAAEKRKAEEAVDQSMHEDRMKSLRFSAQFLSDLGGFTPGVQSFSARRAQPSLARLWRRVPIVPRPLAHNGGGASSSSSQGAAAAPTTTTTNNAIPNNPFQWTAVTRAVSLGYTVPASAEISLGQAVSKACKEHTGKLPRELNHGKLPQLAPNGQPYPTNCFSHEQGLAWADAAIHAFFAERA